MCGQPGLKIDRPVRVLGRTHRRRTRVRGEKETIARAGDARRVPMADPYDGASVLPVPSSTPLARISRALLGRLFTPDPASPRIPCPPNVTDPTDSDDESFLPPFANAENRRGSRDTREGAHADVIEDETEESRSRRRHGRTPQGGPAGARVHAIAVESKSKEAETERHMKRMSEMATWGPRGHRRMEREELDLNDKTVSADQRAPRKGEARAVQAPDELEPGGAGAVGHREQAEGGDNSRSRSTGARTRRGSASLTRRLRR